MFIIIGIILWLLLFGACVWIAWVASGELDKRIARGKKKSERKGNGKPKNAQ